MDGCPLIGFRAEAVAVTVPAKMNLALLVHGRRPDGFHEIESLVVAVTLYDRLVFRGPNDRFLFFQARGEASPADIRNLVWRAAARLARHAAAVPGGAVVLDKSIPAGTGLGGGSADAAGTLAGLNAFWRLGLSDGQLSRLGAEVGADVPFFFHLPAAVVRGRGEQVEQVLFDWPGWVVLAAPDLSVSTAAVYAGWRADSTPAPRDAVARVLDGRRLEAGELSERLVNMLEKPAFNLYPELGRLHQVMERLAGRPVRMTGSGGGLYALLDQQEDAARLADRLHRELGTRTWLLRLLTTPCDSGDSYEHHRDTCQAGQRSS